MIQTLPSLSPSNPMPSAATSRAPVKMPAGGFAQVLNDAPGQAPQESATPDMAPKTPSMAPGIDLAALMQGAAPVRQDSAGITDTPEGDTLGNDTGIALIATGPAASAAHIPPTEIAPAGMAPVAAPVTTPGTATDMPGPELGMTHDSPANLSTGLAPDAGDEGTSPIDAPNPGNTDSTEAAPSLAALASAPVDTTPQPDGRRQTQGAAPSAGAQSAPAMASEITATSEGTPGTGTAFATQMAALPAEPDARTSQTAGQGPVQQAHPETGQSTGQSADQSTGQNTGQSTNQTTAHGIDLPPAKTPDQQPADTGRMPLTPEGQPPATPQPPLTASVAAPSAMQLDTGQPIAQPSGGALLDITSPQWPQELGLIAEDILRTGEGELELRLNPEKLGALTLRIDMTDGRASVTIVTETPEAAKLMLDNQFRLSEQMQRSGFDLSQTVSHNAMSGGSEGQHSRRGGAPGSDGRGQGRGQDQNTTMPNADEARTMPRSGVDLVA